MGLGGVITNLLSLVAKLLTAVTASAAQVPSSSSSPPAENRQIEAELERLMKMLERIKATVYDAEQREIRDRSVQLWLRELKGVAYDAEEVLDKYHFEVLPAQVEARDASPPNPHKRMRVQMPDGIFDQIKQILGKFDEICKHREAFHLLEEDGPRRYNSELQIAPTSHIVVESNILGLKKEKEDLVHLLFSESHDAEEKAVRLLPDVASAESRQIEADLEKLMRMLKRIKATLYDADQREFMDSLVKLWLRELTEIVYDVEDVLGEYHYEVLRAQVEAREAALPNSPKRKQVQIPDSILDQIKHIKGKYEDICQDTIALRPSEEDGPRRRGNELQIAPKNYFVVESKIVGREREKEELIDLLSSECHDCKVSVVTIVGIGGLGKTTLAKLAYNDQRIRQRFDKFGWVCASEGFNVERLMRESVKSITGSNCDLTNMNALQEKISKVIRGERVFLVLDDVWNENATHWELFRAPFMSAGLVKILVTTMNKSVAQIMQTMPTFKLGYLSEGQCWELFQHYAFAGVNQNEVPELVEIGRQIMKKCGMLPFVVKFVADLLRDEKESWKEILESELWEFARNEMFSTVMRSYYRLPTYLKPCLRFCSMFPEGYRYTIQKLVQMWIYQGYIESDIKKNTEEIGREYAKLLWEWSFFESVYEYDRVVFKLHDIIHDLTRLISEDGCSIQSGKIPDFPRRLYHLYVENYVELVEPLPPCKFTHLRTLIVGYGVKKFFSTFDFSKAQKLRVLELRSPLCESEFLSLVVNMKHLRYLSLENLLLERLPECICSLYSLQNLTLKGWPHLKELPESIGNLVSLEELVIDGCPELKVLPGSLSQLKALTKLLFSRCSN